MDEKYGEDLRESLRQYKEFVTLRDSAAEIGPPPFRTSVYLNSWLRLINHPGRSAPKSADNSSGKDTEVWVERPTRKDCVTYFVTIPDRTLPRTI